MKAIRAIFIFVFACVISMPAIANRSLKAFELEYGSQSMSLYGGRVYTLKINGIPSDILKVQMSKDSSPTSSRVVGRRTVITEASENGSVASFNVQLTSLQHDETFKVKTFREFGEGCQIADTFDIAINVLSCENQEIEPVCAQPPVNCEGCELPAARTYKNTCEMNKDNAEFIYDGECQV